MCPIGSHRGVSDVQGEGIKDPEEWMGSEDVGDTQRKAKDHGQDTEPRSGN